MPDLPANTVVVLPKPLPMNRGALFLLFWSIGLLMGGSAVWLVLNDRSATPITSPGSVPNSSLASSTQPTIVVQAILQLPSPTPTETPRPMPTDVPGTMSAATFCTLTPEPGTVCIRPAPTPLPPTPLPSCAEPGMPSTWCQWPNGTPVAVRGIP